MSRTHEPRPARRDGLAVAIAFAIAASFALPAEAAQGDAADAELDTIEVIGSHIRKSELESASPVTRYTRKDIEATGRVALGDVLQQLTASGKAVNSRFNSSGNAGAPPDGGGIGAGSSQVDLRHLEAKRVLILVDGKRWVYESSGSGVGGSVDLNTIPLAIVESIEVLEDGASAVYGSDAIAGVINIVTRRRFEGAEVRTSYGEYDEGDGESTRAELTLGGSLGRFDGVVSVSHQEQKRVVSTDREISSIPVPGTGVTRGSPVTPQGAFVFVTPRTSGVPCAPIDANRDGVPDASLCQVTSLPNTPVGANGAVPFPQGYKPVTLEDSFNAQPYNLALTPNERDSVYASGTFALNDRTDIFVRGLWNERESVNQAAPSPIVLGPEAPGQALADRVGVAANQPFNPFGVPLIPGTNLFALARRPVEAGPRIFEQSVDTHYLSAGVEGSFDALDRYFRYDVSYSTSDNEADQVFRNSFNVKRIQTALGDPAVCAATPGCVPLNLFGGQGADGNGTITPAMLAWIRQDFHDESRQELDDFIANLTGDLFELPAGPVAFATGVEWRRYQGSYLPDPARVAGEVMDLAATVPVRGDYEVNEVYGELNVPLLADVPGAESLDLALAVRRSDYDSFGAETTGKVGLTWRPSSSWLVRGTASEGFRAPFLGELFSLSQFGSTVVDRCSNFGASTDAALIANCTALGVPAAYRQLGFQVFTTTGGNPALEPEQSKSYTAGFVWSPEVESLGLDALDLEVDWYDHTIDDAIIAPAAQDVLDSCIATGNSASPECAGISRNPSGAIGRFVNLLDNIGRIETSGFDFKVDAAHTASFGRFELDWHTTYVDAYEETDRFGNTFTRTVGVESGDGAIPEWQSLAKLDFVRGDWRIGWSTRYIDAVYERCSDAQDNTPQSLIALGLCSDAVGNDPQLSRNKLASTTYHDLQAGWANPFGQDGLELVIGVNNVFDKDPPPCLTCSLNGYDASTYDLPGQFWYVQAAWRFQ